MDPTTIERGLADYYDREGADRADRELNADRLAARERFLRSYSSPGECSLEIGSGPGRDAAAFVAAGLDTYAIDLSPVFASFAAATGASTANATARALPFRDAAFDVVWSMSVLMHIPDDGIGEALGEIARVLRPGGVACIGVWGNDDVPRVLESRFGPRFFANRRASTWRGLLAVIGEVVEFEEWEQEAEGFTYHWAVIRRR